MYLTISEEMKLVQIKAYNLDFCILNIRTHQRIYLRVEVSLSITSEGFVPLCAIEILVKFNGIKSLEDFYIFNTPSSPMLSFLNIFINKFCYQWYDCSQGF